MQYQFNVNFSIFVFFSNEEILSEVRITKFPQVILPKKILLFYKTILLLFEDFKHNVRNVLIAHIYWVSYEYCRKKIKGDRTQYKY